MKNDLEDFGDATPRAEEEARLMAGDAIHASGDKGSWPFRVEWHRTPRVVRVKTADGEAWGWWGRGRKVDR